MRPTQCDLRLVIGARNDCSPTRGDGTTFLGLPTLPPFEAGRSSSTTAQLMAWTEAFHSGPVKGSCVERVESGGMAPPSFQKWCGGWTRALSLDRDGRITLSPTTLSGPTPACRGHDSPKDHLNCLWVKSKPVFPWLSGPQVAWPAGYVETMPGQATPSANPRGKVDGIVSWPPPLLAPMVAG